VSDALKDPGTMTTAELEIVLRLGDAWDAFNAMRSEHGDEREEFRRLIHQAQDLVAARSAYRSLKFLGARS